MAFIDILKLRFVWFLIHLGICCGIQAQTFTYSGTTAIPDNSCSNGYAGTGESYSIPVTGIGLIDSNTVAVEKVVINIDHANTGDLRVWLEGPSGEVLELTTDNGGAGNNYTSTVFRDGAALYINDAVAPFTGTFRPEGRNSMISNMPADSNAAGSYTFKNTFQGTNADGTWKLFICDGRQGAVGSIINWSISFLVSSCVMPTNVGATNVTQNSCQVNWTCLGCSGTYLVEYGLAGFTPGTGGSAGGGTLINMATSPQLISGLQPYTHYDVYVRQNCAGTYSKNVFASFRTLPDCNTAVNLLANPAPVPVALGMSIGSTDSDTGNDIIYDDQGNSYITGSFSGVVDFDPGSGLSYLISNGFKDIFIAKYRPDGTLVWAKSMGGTSTDVATSIAIDIDGNIIICGYFLNGVDFDPGPETAYLEGSAILYDFFLAKYTNNGEYLWALTAGGDGGEYPWSVAVDVDNNIVVGGMFDGTAVDFDPGSGVDTLSSAGGDDIFIAKYSGEGIYQWAHRIGGSLPDRINAIAVDIHGNILAGGYFEGSDIDFDPGPGSTLLSSGGGRDAFVVKFGKEGNLIWALGITGTASESVAGIGVDGQGYVYATGYYSSAATDFDPGSGSQTLSSNGGFDYYLVKYDPNGSFQWVRGAGGTLEDSGSELAVTDYYVYITGYYRSNNWDVDPGSGSLSFTNAGDRDIFIARFDRSGNLNWAFNISGNGLDSPIGLESRGSHVYFSGQFASTNVDIAPGPPTQTVSTSGSDDILAIVLQDDYQAIPCNTYYKDMDRDLFGTASSTLVRGKLPSGYVINSADCNDANDLIHPGLSELCDMLDNNCNGQVDEGSPVGPAGAIYGLQEVLAGDTALHYSTPIIDNADYYNWSYSGTGATISGNQRYVSISFSAGATSGVLSVSGKNGCNSGSSSSLEIEVSQPFTSYGGIWTGKSDFPDTALIRTVSLASNQVGYIIGGSLGVYPYTSSKRLAKYDAPSDQWSFGPDLLGPQRSGAFGFVLGESIFVGGGYGLNDLWEYNPATNAWTQKENFPETSIENAASFSIGCFGYVGTGIIDGYASRRFYQYDPTTNQWTRKKDFQGTFNGDAEGRANAIGISLRNKGYIGGGYKDITFNGENVRFQDWWQYDPDLNDWIRKADLPLYGLREAAGVQCGNKGYIIGGVFTTEEEDRNILNTIFEYDPLLDQWKEQYPMPDTSRYFSSAFSLDQKLFVVGGALMPYGSTNDVWEYDPLKYLMVDTTLGRYIVPGQQLHLNVLTNIQFDTNNVFIAQLSDQNGSFDNPYIIGQLASWEEDSIAVQIPDSLALGAGYRIRFKSTSPAIESLDNGFDLIYQSPLNDFIYGPAVVWKGQHNLEYAVKQLTYVYELENLHEWHYTGQGVTLEEQGRHVLLDFSDDATSGDLVVVVYNSYDNAEPYGTLILPVTVLDTVIHGRGTWTLKADFEGGARMEASGFSVSNRGYLGLGKSTDVLDDIWQYDEVNDEWLSMDTFVGTNREKAASFSLGQLGFITTGDDGGVRKDAWSLNPATGTWRSLNVFLGVSRKDAVSFSCGPYGFVGSGTDGNNVKRKDFWKYDPTTAAWTQIQDLGSQGRTGAIAFTCGNKGYVGLGEGSSLFKDLWEYDYVLNEWSQKKSLPGLPRKNAISFNLGSRGYVGLGFNTGGGRLKDLWEYNLERDNWLRRTDLPYQGIEAAVAFAVNNYAIVGTGIDSSGQTTDHIWNFDPYFPLFTEEPNRTFFISGNTISVPYSVKEPFDEENNFILEMSNDTGSFANPLIIGTLPGISSGIINGIVPSTTPPGSGYRVRVRSTSPAMVADENLNNITVISVQMPFDYVYGPKRVVTGQSNITYACLPLGSPVTYEWSYSGTGVSITPSGGNANFNFGPNASSGFVFVKCKNGSGQIVGNSILYVTVTPPPHYSSGGWDEIYSGMSMRKYATGISSGTKGYLLEGIGYSWPFYPHDMYIYNYIVGYGGWLDNDNISGFAGSARESAVGASSGERIFFGTGVNGSTLYNDWWMYDETTNAWTQKANLGGVAREGAVAFSVGFKMYVATGRNSSNAYLNDLWEYNPVSNAWSQKLSLPSDPRGFAVSFAIGDKAYVGTGVKSGEISLNDLWEYKPATNTWQSKLAFPGGIRHSAVGVELGNRGFVGLGTNGSTVYNDWYEYNPATNKWIPRMHFKGESRSGAMAFSTEKRAIAGTGQLENGDLTNTIYEYDVKVRNDDPEDAIYVPVNSTFNNCITQISGSTHGATTSNISPQNYVVPDDDVWYEFTPGSNTVVVDLTTSFSGDVIMELYSMQYSFYDPINNPITYLYSSDGNYLVATNLQSNYYYLLRVYTYNSNASADFQVCISRINTPPVNDECINATTLSVAGGIYCNTVYFNDTQATYSASDTICENTTADVWFKFTASQSLHLLKFDNALAYYGDSRSLFVVELFEGSCNNLELKECRVVFDSEVYEVSDLSPGGLYYLRIHEDEYDNYGSIPICISSPPDPPANDDCPNAMMVPVNTDYFCTSFVSGTTVGATPSGAYQGCSWDADGDEDDVWFKFVAQTPNVYLEFFNRQVEFGDNTYFNRHIGFNVYKGPCNDLQFLACNRVYSYNDSLNNIYLRNLSVGDTFYIRAYTPYEGVYASFDLCVRIAPPGPPNDSCIHSIELFVNQEDEEIDFNYGTTLMASFDTLDCLDCPVDLRPDVWYTFTATSDKILIDFPESVDASSGTQNIGLKVDIFEGLCTELVPVTISSLDFKYPKQFDSLIPGHQYFIRISSHSDINVDFKIVIKAINTGPENDECENSILLTESTTTECTNAVFGSTIGATASSIASYCNVVDPNDDVWYHFEASGSRMIVNIDVYGQPESRDLVFQLYEQVTDCGDLQLFRCYNYTGQEIEDLIVGRTYYVRAYSTGYGDLEPFRICLKKAPLNTSCDFAHTLTVNGDESCSQVLSNAEEGWYKFTATEQSHVVSMSNIHNLLGEEVLPAKFKWYKGTCDSLVLLTEANNYDSLYRIMNNLVIGTTYFLHCTSVYSETVLFDLCVSTLPNETLTSCQDPMIIPVNSGSGCLSSVSLVSISHVTYDYDRVYQCGPEIIGPTIDGSRGIIWLRFTATSKTHKIEFFDVKSATAQHNSLFFDVLSGACDSTGLRALACSIDKGIIVFDELSIGQQYYIRAYQREPGIVSFKACITTPSLPAKTSCSGAIPLVVNNSLNCNNSYLANTAGTSQSYRSCLFDNSADDDIWFKFTATRKRHKLSVYDVLGSDSSDIGIMREIFKGACGNLESIVCSHKDEILDGLSIGETYFIRAFTEGDSVSAQFRICIQSFPDPPANDVCTGAINLPVNSTLLYQNVISGSTLNATESRPPCNGGKANDVWYKFTPTKPNISVLIVPASGSIDKYYAYQVFSGSCNSLSPITSCWGESNRVIAGLTPNVTYYIRVYELSGLHSFDFTIGYIQYDNLPANDNCPNANLLTVNSGDNCTSIYRGTNYNATQSYPGECDTIGYCDDVWHKFVATSASHLVRMYDVAALNDTSVAGNLGVRVYSMCNENALLSAHDTVHLLTGLMVGQTYYLRVGSYTGDWPIPIGVFNYSLCVSTPFVPGNDLCTDAIEIVPDADDWCSSGTRYFISASGTSTSCFSDAAQDLWFEFDASAESHYVYCYDLERVLGINFDLAIEVYKGSCLLDSFMYCSLADTVLLEGLDIDTQYLIRIYAVDSSGKGWFRLCVSTPDSLSNDDCNAATLLTVNSGPECEVYTFGSTRSASTSSPACSDSSAVDDIWYSFTATSPFHEIHLYQEGATMELGTVEYEMYSGVCDSLVSMGCFSDDVLSFDDLIPGVEYSIRLYSKMPLNVVWFNICVSTPYVPMAPVNDNASGALPVIQKPHSTCEAGDRYYGSFYFASQSPQSNCAGAGNYDVWYSFEANSTDPYLMVTGKTDIVVEILGGDTSLIIGCLNNNSSFEEDIQLSGLNIGQTYFIRIYPYQTGPDMPLSVLNQGLSQISVCLYGLPANEINPEDPQDPNNPLVNAISGYTQGSFSSSDNGAAIYSIPFILPSGNGGMAPSVGLVYNSFGGNGILGQGWSLGGFSGIVRKGSTYDDAGERKPLNFGATDQYVLDGDRLVKFSMHEYGADSCEYRLEHDPTKRIISYGNVIGSGTPEKFVVWSKDGLISEYGYTEDSRIQAMGRYEVGTWLINKISDASGNYIVFEYEEDAINGFYYPRKIEYTGNTTTGQLPTCRVEFLYEAREDVSDVYTYGALTRVTKRLKEVRVLNEGHLIRRYKTTYDNNAERRHSRLTSIQECGLGNECLAPTVFEWTEGEPYFINQPDIYFNRFPEDTIEYKIDYIAHMIPVGTVTESRCLWKICKTKTYLVYEKYIETKYSYLPRDIILQADFNGDGLQDLLTHIRGNEYSTIQKNDGNYNFTDSTKSVNVKVMNPEMIQVHDFNNDGFSDFIVYDTLTGASRWYANNKSVHIKNLSFTCVSNKIPVNDLKSSASGEFKMLSFQDFNGDGYSEAVIISSMDSTNYKLFINNAGNFSLNTGTIPSDMFRHSYYFMDYNGDGLQDLMQYNYSTKADKWYKNISKLYPQRTVAFQLEAVDALGSFDNVYNAFMRFGDFNGDGLQDIYLANINAADITQWYNAKILLNRGNLTFREVPQDWDFSWPYESNSIFDFYFSPFDVNGDGSDDLLLYNYETGHFAAVMNDGRGYFGNTSKSGFRQVLNNAMTSAQGGVRPVSYRHGNVFSLFWNDIFTGENRIIDFRIENSPGTIKKITEGHGREIEITYTPLTSDKVYQRGNTAVYPYMDLFNSTKVVSEYIIKANDIVLGHFQNRYKGGILNLLGRGNRGFQEVENYDILTGYRTITFKKTDHRYLTSPVYLRKTFLPNGELVNQTDYELHLDSLTGPGGGSWDKIYYAYPRKVTTSDYDIDGSLLTFRTLRQQISSYGNLMHSVTDYGEGIKDSLVCTYTDNIDKWHLGRMTYSTMYRSLPGQPTDIRSTSATYDAETGQLVQTVVEPDSDPHNRIEKNYIRDDYGNIVESRTIAWDGSAFSSRGIKSTFDAKGRFEIAVTNDLGQVSTVEYDTILGLPVKRIDVNGLITLQAYDNFGRLKKMTYPDGNWKTTQYLRCNGDCPGGAVFYVLTTSSIDPPYKQYYDPFDRLISSEYISFNGDPVRSEMVYTETGQVAMKSDPHFINELPKQMKYEYDLKNRLIRTVMPGNVVNQTIYSGFCITEINALGQKKTTELTKDGRVHWIKDNQDNLLTFEYDARRNLIKTVDPGGNEIVNTYDFLGYKTMMTDPDVGTTTYAYNRFGELLRQTYPSSEEVIMKYDTLGRLVYRTEVEGETFWAYDSLMNGVGMLAYIESPDFTQTFVYDSLGRQIQSMMSIEDSLYQFSNTFDAAGRLLDMTYPTGVKVKYKYNAQNQLTEIQDYFTNDPYIIVQQVNAIGQIEKYTFGNGVTTTNTYDPERRYLTGIRSVRNDNLILDHRYQYDLFMNLVSKENLKSGLLESYSYDNLNRLISYKPGSHEEVNVTYDVLGNITYKSDVGHYYYGENGQGPHQLTRVEARGDVCIPSAESVFSYTSFNKVKSMENDSMMLLIKYGPERGRIVHTLYRDSVLVERKVFLGLVEIVEDTNGVKSMSYIYGPDGVAAVVNQVNDSLQYVEYWQKDYQGSLQAITDNAGQVIQELFYDPWGARRNGDGSVTDSIFLSGYNRGYTSHEHYDFFDLINMNGRIQDPVLGRFISPDPSIPYPSDLQAYNRYSYALNNPLLYTDPSGYTPSASTFAATGQYDYQLVSRSYSVGAFKLDDPLSALGAYWDPWDLGYGEKIVKEINRRGEKVFGGDDWNGIKWTAVSVVMTYFGGAEGAALAAFWQSFATKSSNGASFGDAVLSASYNGLQAYAVAAATYEIGEQTSIIDKSTGMRVPDPSLGAVTVKVAGHGLIQGASAELDGGKFTHGFVVGAVTAGSEYIPLDKIGMTAGSLAEYSTAALIGGTTSVIAGGDFVNGAVTAFMIYYFNKNGKYSIEDYAEDCIGSVIPEGKILKATGGTKDAIDAGIHLYNKGESVAGMVTSNSNSELYWNSADLFMESISYAGSVPSPAAPYLKGASIFYNCGIKGIRLLNNLPAGNYNYRYHGGPMPSPGPIPK